MSYQVSDPVDIPRLQQILDALQTEIDERERIAAALARQDAELHSELQRRLAERLCEHEIVNGNEVTAMLMEGASVAGSATLSVPVGLPESATVGKAGSGNGNKPPGAPAEA